MGRVDQQGTAGPSKGKRRLRGQGPRMRQVVVAAGIIGAVGAPLGMAATGANLREGVRNGTAKKETQIIGNFKSSTGLTGGYVTRQSNLSSTGGGAIYGCRSGAGGSAANPPQNPCIRANNLSKGFAFEFSATDGDVVGSILAGNGGGDSKKPFTTNATGVATGLNADRVDGQNAADIQKAATDAAATDATAKATAAKNRWVLINEAGQIEKQSGGFTVLDGYTTNNNVYIDAGEDLSNNGINATIALQNQTDTNASGSATDNEFGGEISVAQCQQAGTVVCAPANSKTPNAFVISPRNSDGTATAGTQTNPRKRFYVQITG